MELEKGIEQLGFDKRTSTCKGVGKISRWQGREKATKKEKEKRG